MTRSRKIFLVNWLLPVPVAAAMLTVLSFITGEFSEFSTFLGLFRLLQLFLFFLFFGYILMAIPSMFFAFMMRALETKTGLDFSKTGPRAIWIGCGTLGGTPAGLMLIVPMMVLLGAASGLVASLFSLQLLRGDKGSQKRKWRRESSDVLA